MGEGTGWASRAYPKRHTFWLGCPLLPERKTPLLPFLHLSMKDKNVCFKNKEHHTTIKLNNKANQGMQQHSLR